MIRFPPMSRERRLSNCLFGLLISAAVMLAPGGCRGGLPDPALTQLVEARKVAADLRVSFAKAVSASDRAVMADTDEASVAFAQEAERTTLVVESHARVLAQRLGSLGYQNEIRSLEEFSRRFTEYRKLDREVLRLAVENTNLKAQRLAFGPVRATADAFRDALQAIFRAAPAKDRCRVEPLVAKATLAVREIQVLQAPHIAEAADEKMAGLEKEMVALEATAHDLLTKLGDFIAPATRPMLANATAALARFESLSGQLIVLSRGNSNVRSLALALGPKPALTATCDASLTGLVEALAKEGLSATR